MHQPLTTITWRAGTTVLERYGAACTLMLLLHEHLTGVLLNISDVFARTTCALVTCIRSRVWLMHARVYLQASCAQRFRCYAVVRGGLPWLCVQLCIA